MKIGDLDSGVLLWKLQYQYVYGTATCSPCPLCRRISRGGDFCKSCIIDEFRNRGVDGGLINHYCQMQNRRLNTLEKLEQAGEKILRECGK